MAFTLMFFFAMSALTLSLLPVVTAELQRRFGLSASQIGLLTSVFMFAYGGIGIPAGVAAARWGGRVLAVSAACFVLGSLVFGLTSSMTGFLVGRGLQGLGGGMVVPVCSPVLAHVMADHRLNRAWGIFGTGWGAGIMLALLIMPSVAGAAGYRAVFLATAGLGLVIGVAALSQKAIRALPQHPEEATRLRAMGRALGAVAINRRVLLLGLFNGAGLAVGVGVLVWTPEFLHIKFGSSASVAAYLTAGLGLTQLVANPLGAASAARRGKLTVIFGSLTAMTVATALIPVVPGMWPAFVFVLLAGFFTMTYFSPLFGLLPAVVGRPEQVGPATGFINIVGFGVSLLTPWIFGLLLDTLGSGSAGTGPGGSGGGGRGYVAGYLLLAAFAAVGTAGVAGFGRQDKSQGGS
jgi:predicted MFS family arabinose efflux permease